MLTRVVGLVNSRRKTKSLFNMSSCVSRFFFEVEFFIVSQVLSGVIYRVRLKVVFRDRIWRTLS